MTTMVLSSTPSSGPTDGLAGMAVDLMDRLGAGGAGLAVAAENVVPPIPSEVVLPLAGFSASRGELGLAAALVLTTVGSVVGALLLYALAAWFGRDRLRAVARRMPLVSLRDVDRAEAWFARHGRKAVLLGRCVPVVRSLVSLPAGVERMPLVPFVALTAIGSAVWNAALVLGGYWLGERWTRIEPVAGVLQYLVLGLAVAAVAWFVLARVGRRPGARAAG